GEVILIDGASLDADATKPGAGGEASVQGISGSVPRAPVIPPGARPATWLVINADRVPRPVQLEIAHAVGRGGGASIIATVSQPLDRVTADGHVAPWFATLFSGKRVAVPSLDARREDILPIVRDVCERRRIPLE